MGDGVGRIMKINLRRDCASLIAAVLLPALLEAQPAFTPHPDAWPAAQSAARDPGVEALVEQLLAQMTLEDKIAQMIQADIAWISPQDLRTYKLGSILAGGGSAPGGNVRTTPQAWLNLTDEFHREALKKSGSHAPIPVLFGIDAVHGNAKLVGATIFPHNVGLGAAHDPDLMRRIGAGHGRRGCRHRHRLDVCADRCRGARCALGSLVRKLLRISCPGRGLCARQW